MNLHQIILDLEMGYTVRTGLKIAEVANVTNLVLEEKRLRI